MAPNALSSKLARPTSRAASRRRASALGGVAVASAAGFGAVAAASARRATAGTDETIRETLAAPARHPARRVAHAVAVPGKWWAYLPAALGVAAYVLRAPVPVGVRLRAPLGRHPERSRAAGAGAVLLASGLAAALGPAFDRWLPQPPAPPGQPSRRKPVFPSGHALGPTAMAVTSAYVLTRESLAPSGAAWGAALAYLLVPAGGKLVEQRHWASDVLGGYLGGAAIAAGCLAAYELADG
jgi:membrane-associated phospholipid phosphatase